MVDKKKIVKYKAINSEGFKASYNDVVPCYEELSNGKSVELDINNKHVQNLLLNNILYSFSTHSILY